MGVSMLSVCVLDLIVSNSI